MQDIFGFFSEDLDECIVLQLLAEIREKLYFPVNFYFLNSICKKKYPEKSPISSSDETNLKIFLENSLPDDDCDDSLPDQTLPLLGFQGVLLPVHWTTQGTPR